MGPARGSPIRSLLVALALALAGAACRGSAAPASARAPRPSTSDAARFDLTALDRRVDPCADFYDFACGGWRRAHPIPPDRVQWSRYAELQELNLARERALVEAAARAGDAGSARERRVGAHYAACMDEPGIEARGLAPLRDVLARIGAARDAAGVTSVVAELHSHGVPALFDVYRDHDLRDARVMVASLDRGALGLRQRDAYLRADAPAVALRERYVEHLTRVLALLGSASPRADADRVLAFETALARGTLSAVEARDAGARYHPTSLDAMRARWPAFDWAAYARARGLSAARPINVRVPAYLDGVDAALSSGDLGGLRVYLAVHLAKRFAPSLPRAVEAAFFDFHQRQQRGAREMAPRWKRCLRLVDDDLGDDVGRMFVARYFPEASRARAGAMVDALVAAFRADLAASAWLGASARAAAVAKLARVRVTLGYSNAWRDYDALRVERGDAFGNAWRANAATAAWELATIGRPPDRDELAALAQSLSGHGNKHLNTVGFTAGFLQPPVFDPRLDDAVTFGGFGGVIGHELTHHFDDEGRKYDPDGNHRDWWEAADVAGFEARARCFVDEYAGFRADDGTPLDGRLTLGENIADNGGLRLAWAAARPSPDGPRIDGFTPAQRFFLGWAQIRCENTTPAEARRRAQTDEHAPGRWRVNGVVSNMPEFARAFSCGPGAPMVRPRPCRVW